MVCESYIAQERRTRLQQRRAYITAKRMAPSLAPVSTPTTYSLQYHRTPTKAIEGHVPPVTDVEQSKRARRMSAKVAENKDIKAT